MYRTLKMLLAAGGLLLLAAPARCDNYSMPNDSDGVPWSHTDGVAHVASFSGQGWIYLQSGVTTGTYGGGPAPGANLTISQITFDMQSATHSLDFNYSYDGYLDGLNANDGKWYQHWSPTVNATVLHGITDHDTIGDQGWGYTNVSQWWTAVVAWPTNNNNASSWIETNLLP